MTSLAGAVLIYFFGTGFLETYFVSRTTLTMSFGLSDAELSQFRDRMRSTEEASQELAREIQELRQGTGGPVEDLKRPPEIHSTNADPVHVHEEHLPRQSHRG
jgi:thiamine monophosphate synthase